MRKKILLYYLILVVIGVMIASIFASQLTQRLYTREVEEKLKSISLLIENDIEEDISSGTVIDLNQKARTYSNVLFGSTEPNNNADNNIEGSKTRITFINNKGDVIGESETDYQTMENHLNREEIQEAIKSGFGNAIRHSTTLDVDFLYIAVPIESGDLILRLSVPLTQLKRIDQLIWSYALLGILAGLAITSLLAVKFSSSIIRPVRDLMEAVRDISMGNYSKRVNVNTSDELGQLADTFNEMASKLELTVAELVDKNVKVESIMNSMINGIIAVDSKYRIIHINPVAREMFGIAEELDVINVNMLEFIRQNQINAQIHETIGMNRSISDEIAIGSPESKILRVYTNPIKPAASNSSNSGGIIFIQDITNIKKLEQVRTDFVSNVTHELKTPLTSIRGFVETLRAGAINDPDVAEKFLEIIDIEAERLYMLINDILQLSEIESSKEDTNISTVNLKAVIGEVLSILNEVAGKKGVTLVDETSDEPINIEANRNRLKQMLINLIDNGIKYNKDNGSVTIKARRLEGRIVITVRDTGIGIDRKHFSRIFERFYRVDKGRSRSMGGTGLGLSIVKHIVNLYNGDINVDSEPGKGTKFTISLPV